MLCPKCKTDRAYRAHRVGLAEKLASFAGFFPYECRGCHNHFLRYQRSSPNSNASLNPAVEREIAATRAAGTRKRKQREIILYGLALFLFMAILYLLTRTPSAGA